MKKSPLENKLDVEKNRFRCCMISHQNQSECNDLGHFSRVNGLFYGFMSKSHLISLTK